MSLLKNITGFNTLKSILTPGKIETILNFLTNGTTIARSLQTLRYDHSNNHIKYIITPLSWPMNANEPSGGVFNYTLHSLSIVRICAAQAEGKFMIKKTTYQKTIEL